MGIVGLVCYGCNQEKKGLVLYFPIGTTTTYLINENNEPIYEWTSEYIPGQAAYLDQQGFLVKAGFYKEVDAEGNYFNNAQAHALGGVIERSYVDALTKKTVFDWRFNYWNDIDEADINQVSPHHDIALLPSGNILALLWQRKTYDEAIKAGRDPNTLSTDLGMFAEKIVELEKTENENGSLTWNIVWQWDIWDHFVQMKYPDKDHYVDDVFNYPNRIDINYNLDTDLNPDVFHVNAIYYIEEYDQLLISSLLNSEIWVIDHSTSTAEAATSVGGNYQKGGDLLYRWGNPQAYGYPDDSYHFLSGVHDPNVVLNKQSNNNWGTFLMYNNSVDTGRNSQIIEITPPITMDGAYVLGKEVNGIFGPITTTLMIDIGVQEDNFGTAQRLISGETLTCDCGGTGNTIWIDRFGKITMVMALAAHTINAEVPDAIMDPPSKYRLAHPPQSKTASFRTPHYWDTDFNVRNIEK